MPQRKKVDFARRVTTLSCRKVRPWKPDPQRERPAVETGGILQPEPAGPSLMSGRRLEACVSRFRAVAAQNA
jgi:hypothetical protein